MAEKIDHAFIDPGTPCAAQIPNRVFRVASKASAKYSSSDWFWTIGIFTASCAVMLPLVLFGVPDGYDLGQHLRLAQAFRDGITAGHFVPSWGASDNYGFGSIGIRIYPPVFDYLWGLASILTGDYFVSVLGIVALLMFPGCIGVYFWARQYVSPRHAATAALSYLIVPYHLMQVYQAGLLSEFAAAAVLPFCFLFATRIIKNLKMIDMLGLSISYGLLILTHIPSIIIGSLSLLIYCLVLMDWRKPIKTLASLAISLVLAAGASSFYWLKVVSEFSWIKVTEAKNFSGHYDYRQYLFPLFYSATADTYWGHFLWLADIAIVLTFLFVIPAAIVLFTTEVEQPMRRLFRSLVVTSLFILFIVSAFSNFIWENSPLLFRIQFPWRFLLAGSIFATMSLALAMPLLWARFPSSQRLMGYILLIFIGSILIFDLGESVLPSAPLARESFEKEFANLNESKGCDCFWPTWANGNAFAQKERLLAGDRTVDVVTWDAEVRHFTIREGTPENVRVATFWYPYWKADVNGSPIEVGHDENGAITLPIPAENSKVTLYFEEPPFLQAAKYLSLLTWIALIVAVPCLGLFAGRRKIAVLP